MARTKKRVIQRKLSKIKNSFEKRLQSEEKKSNSKRGAAAVAGGSGDSETLESVENAMRNDMPFHHLPPIQITVLKTNLTQKEKLKQSYSSYSIKKEEPTVETNDQESVVTFPNPPITRHKAKKPSRFSRVK